MHRFRATAVALVSSFALASFATTVPAAFAHRPAPCVRQQAHVDKATGKLADLTVRFAAHPTQKNLKAKRAQAHRLAHATTRLDTCLAAQSS